MTQDAAVAVLPGLFMAVRGEANPEARGQYIETIERRLDHHPRRVIPTKRIPEVVNRIETGDVLAFATEIPGLDVTHAAFAHRVGDGVLRVLHAPLSGGVVQVTRTTLPEYVADRLGHRVIGSLALAQSLLRLLADVAGDLHETEQSPRRIAKRLLRRMEKFGLKDSEPQAPG